MTGGTAYVVVVAACASVLAVWRGHRAGRAALRWRGTFRGATRVLTWLRAALLVAAALASAGLAITPTWHQSSLPGAATSLQPSILFVVDVSRSMTAADAVPTRRAAAAAIVRQIAHADADRAMGVMAMAGEARLICPPTTDRIAMGMALDELPALTGRLAGGSDVAGALELALATLRRSTDRAAIVVLSDGEATGGDPGAAADALTRARVPIHTVGIGSVEGAWVNDGRDDGDGTQHLTRLDERFLRSLAARTSGRYVSGSGNEAAAAVRSAIAAAPIVKWGPHDGRQWWIALVLAALVLEAGIGRFRA